MMLWSHLMSPKLCILSLLLLTCYTWRVCSALRPDLILPSNHTSVHAVIVSSSRYWFNYRHVSNALSIYQLLRQNGVPDENIVLMLADDIAGNARNPHKNGIYVDGVPASSQSGSVSSKSLYKPDTQVDYRGDDVTVQNFVNALLGQSASASTTRRNAAGKRILTHHDHESNPLMLPILKSDKDSHVIVYLTGHGGNQFFKFQDVEEITSVDIANLFAKMHAMGKYKELLFVADTCQAHSLADDINAPNVRVVTSSLKDENSYAHHGDRVLGLSVVDRYTFYFVDHVKKSQARNRDSNINNKKKNDRLTLKEAMVDAMPGYGKMGSHVGYKDIQCERPMSRVALDDFFKMPKCTTAEPVLVLGNAWKPSLQDGVDIPNNHVHPIQREGKGEAENGPEQHSFETCVNNSGIRETEKLKERGLSRSKKPSDWRFLLAVTGLAGFLIVTSKW